MTDETDYLRMSPEEIRQAYAEKESTASEDAVEADEGWSNNVEFFEEE